MLKIGTVVDGRKVVEVKRVKSLYLSRLMLQIKEHLAEGWEIDETSFRTPVGLIMGNMVKFEDSPSEEINVNVPNEDENKGEESKENEKPSEDKEPDQKEENTEGQTPKEDEKPSEDEKPEEKEEAPAKKTRSTKAKASE